MIVLSEVIAKLKQDSNAHRPTGYCAYIDGNLFQSDKGELVWKKECELKLALYKAIQKALPEDRPLLDAISIAQAMLNTGTIIIKTKRI